jgi:nucleoside-diphosphate-sugar epimerase
MVRVFLTGGTGFLGRRLGARLLPLREAISVVQLPRGAGADLLAPSSYERDLEGADVVLHLAAVTGKAPASAHMRVNLDGTCTLLEQSRRCGVRRFVFVSSIAAKFPDVRRYAYARSKVAAEAAVTSSGLPYTIVRPTIIAGAGSPVLDGLRRLASLPVVPVFGTGDVRVQPIFVDDLAECLVSLVRDDVAPRQTLEFGGPEVVTIRQLLGEVRRVVTGTPLRALRVPLAPLLPVLGVLETIAPRLVPVTVGQLSTFRFDGVATPNPLFERHRAGMLGVQRMLELSLAG